MYIGCILILLIAYESQFLRDLFPRLGSTYSKFIQLMDVYIYEMHVMRLNKREIIFF